MKTLLVPTDFSSPAENAAVYAMHLAKGIRANIKLCHATKVFNNMFYPAQVTWPIDDMPEVDEGATESLKLMAGRLSHQSQLQYHGEGFQPEVSYCSECGETTDVITNTVTRERMPLVVMGMAAAGGISRMLFGSSSNSLIEHAHFPVLLVPATYKFKPIKKIAFATTLKKEDIAVVHALAGLAKYMQADILLTHVTDESHDGPGVKERSDAFLKEVCNKANYDRIYYSLIKGHDVDKGLDWLAEHGQIDMLVLVHHNHGFIKRIFGESITLSMATHTTIPLLVFSGRAGAVLPAF
ncbi:universal stress protein [Mucilaginibacter agri]|uniref:Universal stress protein n=1 Tax=Mucilaginibacter agri TaxID=2695265 RepID=A0A966DT00_9SPHI|nr:universal stress protein [Mucilaginibacter agri]NCD68244.1 universal stress protein [Mucilaginibacter agri]